MKLSRSELESFFVYDASAIENESGGIAFSLDAKKSAEFLTKLRNVSRLCQVHSGGLNRPKSRKDVKYRILTRKEESKNLLRILLGLRLGQFYELEDAYPKHKFCPYVTTLWSAMEEYDFFGLLGRLENKKPIDDDDVEVLERIVDRVKSKTRSREFKEEVLRHERSAKKNYREAWRYVCGLFDRYAKLLVIRIDFHYHEDLYKPGCDTSYVEVTAHRDKLLRSMRYRKEFNGLVGMIWKVEYAPIKGYHMHGLFFFDGNKRCKTYSIHQEINNFWSQEVTKGKGYVYAVDPKKPYKYPFVGMVRCYDKEKLKGLKYAIQYLTKIDFMAKLNVPGRVFGKTVNKPKAGKKRGRPRQKEGVQHLLTG